MKEKILKLIKDPSTILWLSVLMHALLVISSIMRGDYRVALWQLMAGFYLFMIIKFSELNKNLLDLVEKILESKKKMLEDFTKLLDEMSKSGSVRVVKDKSQLN